MQHKSTTKNELRARRHARVRAHVKGTALRPRLAVYRSNRFISAQLIDDTAGKTVAVAHGRECKGPSAKGGLQAEAVGKAIAKAAKAAGISAVVFDRAGYRYSGQVKALAEAARSGGLVF